MKKHYLSKDLSKSYLIPGLTKHNIVGRYYSKVLAPNKKLSTISYFKYNKHHKHSEYSSFTDRDLSQDKVLDTLENKLKLLNASSKTPTIVVPSSDFTKYSWKYNKFSDLPPIQTVQQKAYYSASPILLEAAKTTDGSSSQSSGSSNGENTTEDAANGTKWWDYKNVITNIMTFLVTFTIARYFTNKDANKIDKKNQIAAIENKLADYGEDISRDHLSITSMQKANLKNDAKQIMSKIMEDKDILKYFKGSSKNIFDKVRDYFEIENEDVGERVGIETLVQLAHCCNSVATNKLYNLRTARKELEQVKEILETRIRKAADIDIEKLINEQNYKFAIFELKNFGNELLAEYTILKYLHARSYIYEYGANKGKYYSLTMEERAKIKQEFVAVKELSASLGEKHKMLEHVISQRNGLNIIRDLEISEALEKGDRVKAKDLIKENIESYQQIRDDETKYIREYQLGKPLDKQNKILLKDDYINFLTCERQIIKCYSSLITLAETEAEKTECLANFEQIFTEAKAGERKLLDIIKNASSINPNIKASVVLNIGEALLSFYKSGIAIEKICSLIKKQLTGLLAENDCKLEEVTSELQLIESLIDLGSLARSDYKLKARDSYEELAQLKLEELSKSTSEANITKKLALLENIIHILDKRNNLNNMVRSETKKKYIDYEFYQMVIKLVNKEISDSSPETLANKIYELKEQAETLYLGSVQMEELELNGALNLFEE